MMNLAVVALLFPPVLLYIFLYLLAHLFAKEAMKKSAQQEIWEWMVNIFLFFLLYTFAFSPSPAESVAGVALSTLFSSISSWGWGGSYDETKPVWENGLELFSTRSSEALEGLSLTASRYRDVAQYASTTFRVSLTTSPIEVGSVTSSSSTSLGPCHAYSLLLEVLYSAFQQLYSFHIQLLNLSSFLRQMVLEGTVTLFLLVGFFFRSFPITRPIGGFLIAFSLATLFILPAAYIFMDGIYSQTFSTSPPQKAKAAIENLPLPGGCRATTLPFNVENSVREAMDAFYSRDFQLFAYASLLTYAFAWLIYFSAMMSIMTILGASVSPFILNMLLRV